MIDFTTNDFLKVLLALKENIAKDIHVATFGKVKSHDKTQNTYVIEPFPQLQDENKSIICTSISQTAVVQNDLVLVLFLDRNFIQNYKQFKLNQHFTYLQNLSELHSEKFGVIISNLSSNGGSLPDNPEFESIKVIDTLIENNNISMGENLSIGRHTDGTGGYVYVEDGSADKSTKITPNEIILSNENKSGSIYYNPAEEAIEIKDLYLSGGLTVEKESGFFGDVEFNDDVVFNSTNRPKWGEKELATLDDITTGGGTSVDLSNYYTKTEADNNFLKPSYQHNNIVQFTDRQFEFIKKSNGHVISINPLEDKIIINDGNRIILSPQQILFNNLDNETFSYLTKKGKLHSTSKVTLSSPVRPTWLNGTVEKELATLDDIPTSGGSLPTNPTFESITIVAPDNPEDYHGTITFDSTDSTFVFDETAKFTNGLIVRNDTNRTYVTSGYINTPKLETKEIKLFDVSDEYNTTFYYDSSDNLVYNSPDTNISLGGTFRLNGKDVLTSLPTNPTFEEIQVIDDDGSTEISGGGISLSWFGHSTRVTASAEDGTLAIRDDTTGEYTEYTQGKICYRNGGISTSTKTINLPTKSGTLVLEDNDVNFNSVIVEDTDSSSKITSTEIKNTSGSSRSIGMNAEKGTLDITLASSSVNYGTGNISYSKTKDNATTSYALTFPEKSGTLVVANNLGNITTDTIYITDDEVIKLYASKVNGNRQGQLLVNEAGSSSRTAILPGYISLKGTNGGYRSLSYKEENDSISVGALDVYSDLYSKSFKVFETPSVNTLKIGGTVTGDYGYYSIDIGNSSSNLDLKGKREKLLYNGREIAFVDDVGIQDLMANGDTSLIDINLTNAETIVSSFEDSYFSIYDDDTDLTGDLPYIEFSNDVTSDSEIKFSNMSNSNINNKLEVIIRDWNPHILLKSYVELRKFTIHNDEMDEDSEYSSVVINHYKLAKYINTGQTRIVEQNSNRLSLNGSIPENTLFTYDKNKNCWNVDFVSFGDLTTSGDDNELPQSLFLDDLEINNQIIIYSDGSDITNPPSSNDIDATFYSKGIHLYDNDTGKDNYLYFPQKTGTFVVTNQYGAIVLENPNNEKSFSHLDYGSYVTYYNDDENAQYWNSGVSSNEVYNNYCDDNKDIGITLNAEYGYVSVFDNNKDIGAYYGTRYINYYYKGDEYQLNLPQKNGTLATLEDIAASGESSPSCELVAQSISVTESGQGFKIDNVLEPNTMYLVEFYRDNIGHSARQFMMILDNSSEYTVSLDSSDCYVYNYDNNENFVMMYLQYYYNMNKSYPENATNELVINGVGDEPLDLTLDPDNDYVKLYKINFGGGSGNSSSVLDENGNLVFNDYNKGIVFSANDSEPAIYFDDDDNVRITPPTHFNSDVVVGDYNDEAIIITSHDIVKRENETGKDFHYSFPQQTGTLATHGELNFSDTNDIKIKNVEGLELAKIYQDNSYRTAIIAGVDDFFGITLKPNESSDNEINVGPTYINIRGQSIFYDYTRFYDGVQINGTATLNQSLNVRQSFVVYENSYFYGDVYFDNGLYIDTASFNDISFYGTSDKILANTTRELSLSKKGIISPIATKHDINFIETRTELLEENLSKILPNTKGKVVGDTLVLINAEVDGDTATFVGSVVSDETLSFTESEINLSSGSGLTLVDSGVFSSKSITINGLEKEKAYLISLKANNGSVSYSGTGILKTNESGNYFEGRTSFPWCDESTHPILCECYIYEYSLGQKMQLSPWHSLFDDITLWTGDDVTYEIYEIGGGSGNNLPTDPEFNSITFEDTEEGAKTYISPYSFSQTWGDRSITFEAESGSLRIDSGSYYGATTIYGDGLVFAKNNEQYIYNYPNKSGTLATLEDIDNTIGDINSILDILNGEVV